MTPNQFKSCINALGLSQMGMGRVLKVPDRRIRRFIAGTSDIPADIAIIVEILCGKKTFDVAVAELRARVDAARAAVAVEKKSPHTD